MLTTSPTASSGSASSSSHNDPLASVTVIRPLALAPVATTRSSSDCVTAGAVGCSAVQRQKDPFGGAPAAAVAVAAEAAAGSDPPGVAVVVVAGTAAVAEAATAGAAGAA